MIIKFLTPNKEWRILIGFQIRENEEMPFTVTKSTTQSSMSQKNLITYTTDHE